MVFKTAAVRTPLLFDVRNYCLRLRARTPSAANPLPNKNIVAGSGTGVVRGGTPCCQLPFAS